MFGWWLYTGACAYYLSVYLVARLISRNGVGREMARDYPFMTAAICWLWPLAFIVFSAITPLMKPTKEST